MPNILAIVVRFAVSVFIAAALIGLAGRMFSDFDEPASDDPHDLIRGIGVWLAAVLVAVLNEIWIQRKTTRKAGG
jgi:hypothetical protein